MLYLCWDKKQRTAYVDTNKIGTCRNIRCKSSETLFDAFHAFLGYVEKHQTEQNEWEDVRIFGLNGESLRNPSLENAKLQFQLLAELD